MHVAFLEAVCYCALQHGQLSMDSGVLCACVWIVLCASFEHVMDVSLDLPVHM
jgi:hypothetical protein